MAIANRASSATLSATVAVTAINPAVDATATATDLSVLFAGGKPYGVVMTTDPNGWSKLGEQVSGTVANSAADLGTPKIGAWYDIGAVAGAIGNMTFSGTPNTMNAGIETYQKDIGDVWETPVYTGGSDTSSGANCSITGGGSLSVQTGDMIVVGCIVNGDVGTLSALAIGGMAGATIGSVTTHRSAAVTTGFDNRLITVDALITAGSSASAPTFSYTNASSGMMAAIFVRLRVSPATNYDVASTALAVTADRPSDARARPWTVMLADGYVTK